MTTRFPASGKKIEIASRAIASAPKFPATAASNDEWTVHSSSEIRINEDSYTPQLLDRDEMSKRCPVHYSQADCYEYFSEIGLEYAGVFKGIKEAWRGDIEAFTRVELPQACYGYGPRILYAVPVNCR